MASNMDDYPFGIVSDDAVFAEYEVKGNKNRMKRFKVLQTKKKNVVSESWSDHLASSVIKFCFCSRRECGSVQEV